MHKQKTTAPLEKNTVPSDVLHGVWQPEGREGLHLWIESYELSLQIGAQQKKIKYHPYALEHEQLIQRLADGLSYYPTKQSAHKLLLSLPTEDLTQVPLASWDMTSSSTALIVTHWQIPSLLIPKDHVLDFLMLLGQKSFSYKLGASLTYWQALGQCILELIDKGAFYPSIELCDSTDSYKACWKPTLSDAYIVYLHKLAAAMPPLCRSFTTHDYTALFLSTHFIEETIDAFIKKNPGPLPTFLDAPFPAHSLQIVVTKLALRTLGTK